jgi:hypothetical protein
LCEFACLLAALLPKLSDLSQSCAAGSQEVACGGSGDRRDVQVGVKEQRAEGFRNTNRLKSFQYTGNNI